jgi:pilus assembly protein FimV
MFRSGGAKEKKAKPAPSKQDTIKAAKPIKAPLGDRLKAMFAPLGGLFTSSKKPALISVMAGSSANRRPDDELEQQFEDSGEEEPDSFDETVMVAAAAVGSGKPAAGSKPSPKVDLDKTAIGEPLPQQVEPEGEVTDDTTAEADVYLAYGLFDQAEELLKQALVTNPRKLEYKGKLLETYFAAGKQSDFEKLAADLQSSLKGKPSRIWDKAVVMGKELAPANPLFSGGDSSLKVSDFAPAKPQMADLDLGETPGATTPDIAFGEEEASSSADFNLDFDVVTGAHEKEQFEETFIDSSSPADKTMVEGSHLDTSLDFQAGGEQSIEEMNIDFNADELGLGGDLDATLVDTSRGSSDEDDSDIGMDEFSSSMPEATVAMDMNFDLDDESEPGSDAFDILSASGTDIDLEDIDDADNLGLSAGDDLIADLEAGDLTAASVETEFEISEEEDTIIDSELTDDTFGGDSDMDEVSTKLDLAKAYMEMGDYDGASSTLEEVLAEGDESQRRQAEEMLDQIS